MEPLLTSLLIVFCLLLPIMVYKRLLVGKKQYLKAFSQIQIQLKRRHDIIPTLADVSKDYFNHAPAVLKAVISARARAEVVLLAASANIDESSLLSLGAVETELNAALRHLQSVIQSHPELKSDSDIRRLIEALDNAESRVAVARQAYNDSAVSYNTMRQSFPANVLAGLLGHNKNAALLKFEDNTAISISPRVLM
ncbi:MULTISPECIES: LemA family protein [Neisseria]|uniref:LemA family protein n=1 Tax=Neisseria musculi TaxID=1815583 RepID=A0A7H1MF27_9NEIS|nr:MULTISPECIES: LemA family protein [Neisseria]MBF0803005.1 LemA family protein [Neisseria sp. 19428wB4_WF04]QNT60242.1 lemA family protein [Neisseria musculi]TFU44303.1 LemA family protein [Neisseria sp. WF04]